MLIACAAMAMTVTSETNVLSHGDWQMLVASERLADVTGELVTKV